LLDLVLTVSAGLVRRVDLQMVKEKCCFAAFVTQKSLYTKQTVKNHVVSAGHKLKGEEAAKMGGRQAMIDEVRHLVDESGRSGQTLPVTVRQLRYDVPEAFLEAGVGLESSQRPKMKNS
jgi:hypothetical protein